MSSTPERRRHPRFPVAWPVRLWAERILAAMDEMHALLATIDFPDAITGNLRRSTDAARAIIERTRGDLTVSLVQRDLRDALDRHAGRLDAPGSPSD